VNAEALVDTDVLVDHLRGHRRLPQGRYAYSVITRCELFAGSNTPDVLRRLLRSLEEIGLDRAIAEAAGALRRQHGLMLADAVVAATARELNLPLVTRNVRHFGRVEGLRLETAAR
jgi:predicted nucleic acid-binding protein